MNEEVSKSPQRYDMDKYLEAMDVVTNLILIKKLQKKGGIKNVKEKPAEQQ